MYIPSVVHLKLVDATLNATIACDEYGYKDNIAVGSGPLESQYSSVKLTVDKGYPLLASV